MQTDGRRAKEAVFSVVFRCVPAVLAVAYAVALVAGTHSPRAPQPPIRFEHADKLMHFVGYLLFAAIVALAMRAAGPWTRWGRLRLAAVLVLFAAIDEITQPFFSRNAELLDWVADCAGIAVGIWITSAVAKMLGRA